MSRRLRFDTYRQKNWIKGLFRPFWIMLRRLPDQVRLFGARTAARIFPFIPIDRDRLYPPTRVCASTPEWISKAGQQLQATITDVDATCTVANPLPKTVHENVQQQFLNDRAYVYPETFVATVPGGRVTNRGFVMTPDQQFLYDVSAYFHGPQKTEAALARDWKLRPLTEVNGRVAV